MGDVTIPSDFEDLVYQWLDEAEDGYVAPILAAKLTVYAQEHYPELLDRWLGERAALFVAYHVGNLARSRRATALQRRSASVFADRGVAHDNGDRSALLGYLDATYVVDAEGRNRRLAVMVWADADYVERRIPLGVDEPTGVVQSFPKNKKANVRGISYNEFVEDVKLSFTVETDYPFKDDEWVGLWTTAERNGLGAMRSQGHGTFDVVRWDRRS